jgi:DUF1680 family protein
MHRAVEPLFAPTAKLSLQLGDLVGGRIQATESTWLLPGSLTNRGIVEMFAHRDNLGFVNGSVQAGDPVPWAGEFVGKYLLSAVQSLRVTGNPTLEQGTAALVGALLATQGSDGSLGMPLSWDLWGQYHVMLGLLRWYEYAGLTAALDACNRAAQLACARYLGRASAIADDNPGADAQNQAVSHALALLYEHTGEPSYLRLVHEIEADWARPPCGDFVNRALAGEPFFTGRRPRWESLHDVQAIGELYLITGVGSYRDAFCQVWRNIRSIDRHVTGGFTSGEAATGDPYDPRYIETCGTVAWMALTLDMLCLTGDCEAADELELSLFNAVLGAQTPDGRLWTYHTPMGGIPINGIVPAARLGYRLPAQYDLAWQARDRYPQFSCCAANGPRGLGSLADWAVMQTADGIVVNYYGQSSATVAVPDGSAVTIVQSTTYPRDGHIEVMVKPTTPTIFRLRLRLPGWSVQGRVTVNGVPQQYVPGSYCELLREWHPSDVVAIDLDMSVRSVVGERNANGLTALYRGPLLLAYDSTVARADPSLPPKISVTPPPRVEGASETSLVVVRTAAERGHAHLCDFASAGQEIGGTLLGPPSTEGTWQFARSDGTVLCERLQLYPDGTIRGYSNANEVSWRLDGDALTFLSASGQPSTRFTVRLLQLGKQVLSGWSLLDPGVRHILSEVDDRLLDKTWQFSRVTAGGVTILRPAVRLLPDGRFDVPMHANETRWGRDAETLVFYAANGEASTRFTSLHMRNGRAQRSGTFAFDHSITHVLDEVDLNVTRLVWRFSRRQAGTPDFPLADKVRLLADGTIDGYWHPNEARWGRLGSSTAIAFFDTNGIMTTRFGEITVAGPDDSDPRPMQSRMRFEGPSLLDSTIVHVLEEATPGWVIDRTYAVWLPAIVIPGGSSMLVARAPDHMDLFWVAPDGSIKSTWWDANLENGDWDPTRVFAATPAGQAANGPVAVVARAPDHMDLFWVAPDGSIKSTWWDANLENGDWDPTRVFAATPRGVAVDASPIPSR